MLISCCWSSITITADRFSVWYLDLFRLILPRSQEELVLHCSSSWFRYCTASSRAHLPTLWAIWFLTKSSIIIQWILLRLLNPFEVSFWSFPGSRFCCIVFIVLGAIIWIECRFFVDVYESSTFYRINVEAGLFLPFLLSWWLVYIILIVLWFQDFAKEISSVASTVCLGTLLIWSA